MVKQELLLAGTIDDMTIDKFISLMWRKSSVWDEVMEELYMYDYELTQDNAKNIQFFSRLKMINFNIPMLQIPDHCEQTTTVSYLYRRESPMDGSRLGGSIKIQTETNADKFPFTDAFRIIQTYEIQEDGTGINIKISGAADWKKSINFMIKPFISASVKTNLALGAKIVFEKLGGKICYT